jgi:formylglycine-generating enzyme required for sulfatase activity
LTLQWLCQHKDNELTKESAMGMTKGILIVVLSGMFCLGCGKTNLQTGGISGEKASEDRSTNADSENRQPGKIMTNSIDMKLVWIPPGEFQMGSNADTFPTATPIHTVNITKGFYMGIYEVTQEQYQKVIGTNPSYFKGDDNLPVDTVSWDDAVEFCKKLSQKDGKAYRLPTEAEWEYACRAGTTTKFSFGDDESQLGDYAWYNENSGKKPHPVGEKKPNAWGLYDMHGNVWEWCQDWFGSYTSDSQSNPTGPATGTGRVVRGGGWYFIHSSCRVSYRNGTKPVSRYSYNGFRLVLDLK